MNKKIRTEVVNHLFDAILTLQDREECYTFFEDVCTVNELLSLSQRFEVHICSGNTRRISILRNAQGLLLLQSAG